VTEAPRNLCIVGAGRMGLALAMLVRSVSSGARIDLVGRRAEPPADSPLTDGDERVRYGTAPASPGDLDAILLCVPDAAIAGAAQQAAGWGISPSTPVLHTCGAVGIAPLAVLAGRGHPVGAVHPLAAIADPARDWTHLQGALYGVDGDPAALRVAEWLAGAAGGRVVPVPADARPAYHAAAVLASNDVVALLARAAGVMAEAGLPAEVAEAGLAHLAAGAVASVERSGAVAALTGPVVRGDVETVRLHLARLSPPARRVYSCLGAEAVALARKRGLEPGVAAEIADLFEEAG
jgi:predicted short-subunit dehydrogenase-like oxidoreductase (DUF2520 family)